MKTIKIETLIGVIPFAIPFTDIQPDVELIEAWNQMLHFYGEHGKLLRVVPFSSRPIISLTE